MRRRVLGIVALAILSTLRLPVARAQQTRATPAAEPAPAQQTRSVYRLDAPNDNGGVSGAAAPSPPAAALAPAVPSAPGTVTRHALIIGNSTYGFGPLANPKRDAKDLADQLTSLGFEVVVVYDRSLRQLTDAITDYLTLMRAGDVSFVFFAGHGVQVKGENYLLPTDFDARTEADVPYQSYPLGRLLDGLEEHRLSVSIVVLDACRNDPFRWRRSASPGLALVEEPGTLISFSTGSSRTAVDGPSGGNSVFVEALLAHLNDPCLDAPDLFTRVQRDVAARTGQEQFPFVSSKLIDRFFLNGGAACSASSLGAAAPIAALPARAPPPAPASVASTAAAPPVTTLPPAALAPVPPQSHGSDASPGEGPHPRRPGGRYEWLAWTGVGSGLAVLASGLGCYGFAYTTYSNDTLSQSYGRTVHSTSWTTWNSAGSAGSAAPYLMATGGALALVSLGFLVFAPAARPSWIGPAGSASVSF